MSRLNVGIYPSCGVTKIIFKKKLMMFGCLTLIALLLVPSVGYFNL